MGMEKMKVIKEEDNKEEENERVKEEKENGYLWWKI